ncbi:hypothetical protein G6M85_13745 [Agrobacterium tumefaciens]|uniref:hypothetical protein n=1 Tax=Agrobacterium tumefaciens TaxID=358 RepID=UPI000DD5F2C8|nr:hypothetical protein [Agrobacterium tumefaciens]MBP2570268.1 hypothetical protein [Agrobacterium tumefaciens]NTE66670.1 hypothetical protein [Agrobacterium tumefaciens]
MTDQSARLAAFLSKVGPDADLAAMKPEITALFPGITLDEWTRGFALHDECVILDAAETSGHPISLSKEMAAIGWSG